MNTSGEVADLMVKEGIQVTEAAVKLAGLGAKNLAAIVIALLNDDKKLQGKTNLKNLLKTEKPLCILQIKEKDLKTFSKEAAKYGILFTAVTDKNSDTGLCDIIAKNDNAPALGHIMEKLGYTAPEIEPEIEKEVQPEKNLHPRAEENPQRNESMKHGAGEKTDRDTKPSVKGKIEEFKAEKKKRSPEKKPEKTHTPFAKKKKRKKKRTR